MKLKLPGFLKSKDLFLSPEKLICFDFDGVIHSYTSGWRGFQNIPDLPVVGSKEILTNLIMTPNVKVAIFSCWNKRLLGRRAMKKYLKNKVGLNPRLVNQIVFPWFKPAALVMLDDRGLLFEGEFPSIKTHFLAFNPGMRRSFRVTY